MLLGKHVIMAMNSSLFLDFLKQGFSVFFFLVPVLELALVDQAGLELTEIHLLLPPECWD